MSPVVETGKPKAPGFTVQQVMDCDIPIDRKHLLVDMAKEITVFHDVYRVMPDYIYLDKISMDLASKGYHDNCGIPMITMTAQGLKFMGVPMMVVYGPKHLSVGRSLTR